MAVLNLKITVPNLDDVMATFDQIKVYRSTAGELGPFVEITGAGTRLALAVGTVIYEYQDLTGSEAYYYKSSYFNSVTLLESSLSDAQLGSGIAALDVLTVEELKTLYLFGLDLTDDQGVEMPDSLYEHFIKAAVDGLEKRLNIPIIPIAIDQERHDYYREDYDKYLWLEVDHFPILAVSDIRLVLPGEQVVQVFEQDWFHIDKESGQIRLVPGTGTAGSILLGASAAWIPLIYSQNKHIPSAFRVTYTAGFDSGKIPPIIKETVGKIASFGPLNIAGDLLGGAGIASQSLSLDGLSQSFNTTSSSTSSGYGARLIQYEKELKDNYAWLLNFYKGIRLRVA